MPEKHASPLTPPLPAKAGNREHWYGLHGATGALALAQAARQHQGLVLAVTDSPQQAARLDTELRFFLGDAARDETPVFSFPDWETLPYDVFSPHQDIISERLSALYRLPRTDAGILIVPVNTLMQRLAPVSWLEGQGLLLGVGDRLDLDAMRERLEQAGYRCVSEVGEHGEFAVRGALLDLFPMGATQPVRIDLFDDEVETLRHFDPDTQRTTEKIDRIELLPAREFPTDEAGITQFRGAWRAAFEGDPSRSLVYREVSAGHLPAGIEYYLPLFFEQTATLFDYLPRGALIARLGESDTQADTYWTQVRNRYEQRRHDLERPLLAPDRLFLSPDDLRERFNTLPQVVLHANTPAPEAPRPRDVVFQTEPLPDLRNRPQADNPLERLTRYLSGYTGRVLFIAETTGHREALLERLQKHRIRPQACDWEGFVTGDMPIGVAVAPVEHGAQVGQPAMALITEDAIYGDRAQQRRRRRAGAVRDPETIIRDLTDLAIGAPVVHEDHGVGRYMGLQTLEAGGLTTEFLTLEYAKGDKLYVPVSSLHLISRYTGAEGDAVPLHQLGSDKWEKAKKRAAKRARDAAAELLDIYARRAAREGHAYEWRDEDYQAFADGFPFEETPDQESAIAAVEADMRSSRPMDRVVCGDVGFGKTEVAMRAAFMGIQDGRQVAVMVPTTLLAQQHFQNFRDRFSDWPVRVEVLSRFRSTKETNAVLRDLADGKVDIVIGTHKLLQDSVNYKDLGLVIIDEEHRFGVRQKEKLKKLRAEVDILTLTATPIPRTLNMSLAGIRDLSIIATPPARRLAVKTFVNQWDPAIIQEACQRELKRGGQIYFLHNDLDSIDRIARDLEELVPDARVDVAHGQMPERDLERVMLDFYHQRFNILVCSTIIESGIDVPTANTILINRADKLGLAQLHQLRGRVGRSHHRAYAYLIAPPEKAMTADAKKRLEAISSLEELGVGFALASHDLEIRGAGELLGEEQSGQISEVGFNLYTELLDRAVKALQSGEEPALDEPMHRGAEVDLRIPALMPEDYLPDVHTRLVMYKRIANARNEAELDELQVEMIDRFGLLPDPTRNLFRVTALKLRADALGIEKVEGLASGITLHFGSKPKIDPEALIRLIQSSPETYRLQGQEKLQYRQHLPEPDDRIRAVDELLRALRPAERATAGA